MLRSRKRDQTTHVLLARRHASPDGEVIEEAVESLFPTGADDGIIFEE